MTQGYLDDALRGGPRNWAGLSLDALAFQAARLAGQGRWLLVVDAEDRAEQLVRGLRFFHPAAHLIEPLPADDGKPYDGFSPERWRVQQRMRALRRIELGGPVMVVASAPALLQRLPSRTEREKGTRVLEPGQELDRDDLVRWLADAGYLSAPMAELPGSFAVRGDVLDVWPSGTKAAVRVDFFDDEIESIRALEGTRSTGTMSRVLLLPAREERLDAEAAARAHEHLTPYAATNPCEDFAEVFAYFLRHKGRLPVRLRAKPAIAWKWRFIRSLAESAPV